MKKLIMFITISLISFSLFAGIVDYVVVEAETTKELRTEVLKYIEKGYTLQGGAFIKTDSCVQLSLLYNVNSIYCQTLIKEQ